jgi:hypothetical protein
MHLLLRDLEAELKLSRALILHCELVLIQLEVFFLAGLLSRVSTVTPCDARSSCDGTWTAHRSLRLAPPKW